MSDNQTDLELLADEEQRILNDEEELLDELGIFGESRRKFLGQATATGLSAVILQMLAEKNAFALSPEAELAASAQIENAVSGKTDD